ncbi:DUF2958 domain-containing protein [Sphingomonadaceae bacterium G21617-S1]|nr:DUF2958 domain-containing protein [Sphingomonadaceae bacterium G21617-S1]
MILVTPEIRFALRANDISRRAAQRDGKREREPDPVPVLKLFNPVGAATWLATELDDEGDVLFGLADLGFGCPELGYYSLSEIASLRLPFGLGIERDLGFETPFPLSRWADTARRTGSILSAQTELRSGDQNPSANDADPDLPTCSGEPDGG